MRKPGYELVSESDCSASRLYQSRVHPCWCPVVMKVYIANAAAMLAVSATSLNAESQVSIMMEQ